MCVCIWCTKDLKLWDKWQRCFLNFAVRADTWLYKRDSPVKECRCSQMLIYTKALPHSRCFPCCRSSSFFHPLILTLLFYHPPPLYHLSLCASQKLVTAPQLMFAHDLWKHRQSFFCTNYLLLMGSPWNSHFSWRVSATLSVLKVQVGPHKYDCGDIWLDLAGNWWR